MCTLCVQVSLEGSTAPLVLLHTGPSRQGRGLVSVQSVRGYPKDGLSLPFTCVLRPPTSPGAARRLWWGRHQGGFCKKNPTHPPKFMSFIHGFCKIFFHGYRTWLDLICPVFWPGLFWGWSERKSQCGGGWNFFFFWLLLLLN